MKRAFDKDGRRFSGATNIECTSSMWESIYKSILLASIIFVFTPLLSTNVNANQLAVRGLDSLKFNVIESFIQKANNPESQLYQQLKQFNQESIDGRNRDGALPKIIKQSDIQVIPISGEDGFGRYCSEIAKKPGYFQCENSIWENYLILIPYKQPVHKAVGYDSLKFTVKATKIFTWTIDKNENQSHRRELTSIEEPISVNF